MSDPPPLSEEAAALLRRWEQQPTPQLGLQLAEEYGSSGQLDRAAEVLAESVERHPNHLSARVALGRYRLELGQLGEAAAALEQVVQRDPTHLVANKLLVRVYTALGESAKARDRLDLYQLLNESDPEIGSLAAAVEGAGWQPGRASSSGGEGEAERPAEPQAEPRAEPWPEPHPVEVGAPVTEAQTPPSERAARRDDEPFPEIRSRFDVDSYWLQIGAGGIFSPPVKVAPEPAVEDAVEAAASQPAVALEPEPEAPSSVTLAALYRQQGHVEEAERAYREVVSREPANREALRGLAELTRSDDWQLTAFDLLDGEALAAEPGERKRRLLRNYLERLRGKDGLSV